VDGYAGFDRLSDGGRIQLAGCWAHARRKFYEVQQATASPVAAEALRRIAELYAVEATIRGQMSAARRNVRQTRSLPLVTAMKAWLEAQLTQIPPRSGLADAIRYALVRWDALCCFLNDGRIELDTNTVERAIRPIASDARTTSSRDPMAVLSAGRLSARSSPPPSSMTSSHSPISRTCSSACPLVIP